MAKKIQFSSIAEKYYLSVSPEIKRVVKKIEKYYLPYAAIRNALVHGNTIYRNDFNELYSVKVEKNKNELECFIIDFLIITDKEIENIKNKCIWRENETY